VAAPYAPPDDEDAPGEGSAAQLVTGPRERLLDILEYSADINRHRYDLYMWCESKIYSLITVDSLLFGALFLVVGTRVHVTSVINKCDLGFTVACLAASLVISLWHIEPKMDSRVGNYDNPRSSIGIAKKSKEEYLETLMKLDLSKMIEFNSSQIMGMNKIIMGNQRAIKFASVATIIGLFGFIVLMAQGSFK